jgi:hypothetical protein
MAQHIRINFPIWKTRSVGIAENRIIDDLEIEILYQDKNGNRLYPSRYYISRSEALNHPTQTLPSGVKLRIIPIAEMKVLPQRKIPQPQSLSLETLKAEQVNLFDYEKGRAMLKLARGAIDGKN